MAGYEIADSEDESEPEIFASSEEPARTSRQPTPSLKMGDDAVPSPSSSGGTNTIHESASAEQRRKEILELHKALIEPSPDSSLQPQSETATMAKRKASKKPADERDIYEFDVSDEDHYVDIVAMDSAAKPTVKRKRAKTSSSLIDLVDQDSGSDFEKSSKKPRQRKNATVSDKKKRSKTMPAVPVFDVSEDDWTPDSKAQARRSGKKKNHPADRDLESPVQSKRSRRQSAQGKNYFIPPPPGTPSSSDKETRATEKARRDEGDTIEVQSSGVKGFIIELPNNILPTQKKREYDAVSLSTQESFTLSSQYYAEPRHDLPLGSMPDLQSTIPWDSQYQETEHLPPLPSQTLHPDFIQPGVHIENVTEPEPPKKQRAKTDLGISGLDSSMHVASEWRAAKGKGRTNLSDINRRAFSDNYLDGPEGDADEFQIKPKKTRKQKETKPSVKKSKKCKAADVESTEAQIIVVTESTDEAHSDVKMDKSSTAMASAGDGYTDDMVATAPVEGTPALRVKLNVNSTKTTAKRSSPDTAKDNEPSPGRVKRTKSRFYPDEDDASNPSDEVENVRSPAAKDTMAKKAGRKARKIVSDDEDGDFGKDEEKADLPTLSPPPPSPPQKAAAKRKRTKSGKKGDAEVPPLQEEAKSTKRAKSDSKTDVPAAAAIPESTPEAPTKPPISEMSPPPPTKAADRDRSTPKTPGPPKGGASSSKSPEIRRPGGLDTPIPIANRMRHRVGLSKRARIEPLLKIVKKNA